MVPNTSQAAGSAGNIVVPNVSLAAGSAGGIVTMAPPIDFIGKPCGECGPASSSEPAGLRSIVDAAAAKLGTSPRTKRGRRQMERAVNAVPQSYIHTCSFTLRQAGASHAWADDSLWRRFSEQDTAAFGRLGAVAVDWGTALTAFVRQGQRKNGCH